MKHYLDSSAWVKRYLREIGSERVRAIFAARPRITCSTLGYVEVIAAICRVSFAAQSDASTIDKLLARVATDFARFEQIAPDQGLTGVAAGLTRRHRLRTMDAVHLATAMRAAQSQRVVVVSSDAELLAAAAAEGFKILDPTEALSP